MKDKLITFLKAAISLGLMAYLFYRFLSDTTDRTTLLGYLTRANYWYLLLALGLYISAMLANAAKWYILLRAQGLPVPLKAVTNYTFVGFFFNNFLPANMGGDVMRGFGLARYTEQSAEAAVSVVVDRIIGLLAFMLTAVGTALIAVNVILAGDPNTDPALIRSLTQVQTVAVVGTGVMLLGFGIILSHRLRQLTGKLFVIKFLQPFQPLYLRLSNAFGAYRYQYRALMVAFGAGVGTVILTGLADIAIVAGLRGTVPPVYIFLFNPIIAIALAVPISIGGLGTGSVLYVYFYGLVGVSEPLAFALSLVKQAIIYLGSLPGGLMWLRRPQKITEDAVPSLETEQISS